MANHEFRRRLPIGAELTSHGGVHFRVWAPARRSVQVVLEPAAGLGSDEIARMIALTEEGNGYFSGLVAQAVAGTRYRFQLDDDPMVYPDPASRFQPDGCHGPSEVIDSQRYDWQDTKWPGCELPGQILYEMHIGTFTREGTWAAAAAELPELARTGITVLEVMPVAEFPGDFGWGYDGVDLFAPTRLYGRPDEFRAFVDRAHALRMGLILDVVYNHFGPLGNYIGAFSRDYVSSRHHTDWGDALNFDGKNSGPVREFFLANAAYWIDEFHLDGLRLDAVQAIYDDSRDHFLAELTRKVRSAAGKRKVIVTAENELQDSRLIAPETSGGFGLDAVWNDDFHHSARVALTGHAEFYYSDYQGTPQELVSATRFGYLYQGQWNERQQKFRGTPSWMYPAQQFVIFLQNHDQVANSADGLRPNRLTSPGRYRALTAVLLLAPGTPLIFQGQEFGATTPFLYFADHETDLARLVRDGRLNFLRQFRGLAGADRQEHFIDPANRRTFELSKLDFTERQRNAEAYALHQDLIALRRSDPVFSSQRADRLQVAVGGPEAFLLRYFGGQGDDRLLLVNLGRDLAWQPSAEPLLAPPRDAQWELLWSSESPKYGGSGSGVLDTKRWYLPGHTAMALIARQDVDIDG